jgi:phage tail-like protein
MGFNSDYVGYMHPGVTNTSLATGSPTDGWGHGGVTSQSLATASPQLGYGSPHSGSSTSLQTGSPKDGWGSPGVTKTNLATTGTHRRSHDPYGGFRFIVEIDGIEAGAFQKCDGVDFSVDVIEYRDSLHPWGRKRRGQTSFGNIKLTKGYTTSAVLWDWCNEVISGKFGRRTGSIKLLSDDKTDVISYDFYEGFPCKWTGFRFDASSSAQMVEELEFAIEGIYRTG